jgi:hypothetical protein
MHDFRSVWSLERRLWETTWARELRPFFALVIATLMTGTLFYRIIEGWGLLDALYFCVVTLATIGYGDLHPETRIGKLFTIAYIFVGVGTLAVFFSTVARTTLARSGLLSGPVAPLLDESRPDTRATEAQPAPGESPPPG